MNRQRSAKLCHTRTTRRLVAPTTKDACLITVKRNGLTVLLQEPTSRLEIAKGRSLYQIMKKSIQKNSSRMSHFALIRWQVTP